MPGEQTDSPSDEPRRIAFCITELNVGGAERALVELASRLDRRRFEPVVYCLGPRPRGNPTSLADCLEQAGIPVWCFGGKGPLSLPGVCRRLLRRFAEDRPQLVQTFLFHANVLGSWAARRSGVPRVVTGIRVAERHARWHLTLARWADRYADRHVCVSAAVRDFSAESAGLPREKLMVIPNAVDVARFRDAVPIDRRSLGLDADARVLLYVGRLEPQKRVGWLLETLRGVANREPKLALLIVGDGPQRHALVDQAERRCNYAVRFLGWRPDVPQLLAASELLVLPSRWEGLPNVVLEAMAAGRPVVATDVEGVREALGSAAECQVSSVDDPRGFAEHVTAILADRDLAARLAAANFSRAERDFAYRAMVAAYEQLYLELLSGPSAGR